MAPAGPEYGLAVTGAGGSPPQGSTLAQIRGPNAQRLVVLAVRAAGSLGPPSTNPGTLYRQSKLIFLYQCHSDHSLHLCRLGTCLANTVLPSSPSTMEHLTLPLQSSYSLSIWHVGRTFLLMPRGHIPYPLPPNYSYGLCSGRGSRKEEKKTAEPENGELQSNECLSSNGESSGPPQQQNLRSFWSYALSRRFAWHLVWLSVIQLWHYLFIGTLNSLLTNLAGGDRTQVSTYTNAFAITQFFGVLCAPWNGLLMDRLKQRYQREVKRTDSSAAAVALLSAVPSLTLTSLLCLGFALCASIPVLLLQYVTFILQVVSRSFLYGGNAAFLTLGALWKALWTGDDLVSHCVPAAVPPLHPHQRPPPEQPLIRERDAVAHHSSDVRPPLPGVPGVPLLGGRPL
ncbi:Hypothetical predicted protein [Marmota monax]|uniref:Solute carrier family 43 member 3 n=1 Tax=Marmota monax TaxID=9995 RepID=A0A5E4BER7_MARMO|nr:Hypothetical predicted protein [Marmota monax]